MLSEKNFLLYAAKYYENPQCFSIDEFNEDLKRFQYIKRLFNKYRDNKNNLKERLILNHIIILYNVFHPPACTRMLFFKLDGYYELLKPFLIYTNYMPTTFYNAQGQIIQSDTIPMDQNIIDKLRGIRDA
jgi:hypothetical protein